jgi:hypothetical protein
MTRLWNTVTSFPWVVLNLIRPRAFAKVAKGARIEIPVKIPTLAARRLLSRQHDILYAASPAGAPRDASHHTLDPGMEALLPRGRLWVTARHRLATVSASSECPNQFPHRAGRLALRYCQHGDGRSSDDRHDGSGGAGRNPWRRCSAEVGEHLPANRNPPAGYAGM